MLRRTLQFGLTKPSSSCHFNSNPNSTSGVLSQFFIYILSFFLILVVYLYLSSFISLHKTHAVSIALIRSGYHELVRVEWFPSQPYLTSDFCRACNKNREVCRD